MKDEESEEVKGGVPGVADTDSLVLEKNSRGYNWKIKLLGHDVNKLEVLNDEMQKRWGKGAGTQNLD
jgi:hypothetical protein